ncbi:unnamed protein product [Lepeophtheirus salmonis]|uniref:(salmon louse) hypothetical protein n=1 Tax=Lepeophtheirus salmonis TaxID=72036 RepID=A0A7R8H9T4_LEPSM|nr:unnamed protein product [Lepeophtheirus salmonis]CAF2966208.1 unnamed protein product [Lepeophtheirus salmonis]
MRNFFFLLTIAPLTYAKPQGYGVVNAEINVAKEDPNLINDIFRGSGGKGFRDSGLNENNSSIEPEPHYGDGGSHVNEVVDTSSEECAYYADQDYKCVPYYTCEDGEIVTDGGGLIDIRSSFAAVLDPASSKCPGYLEVCCRHPNFNTNAPVVTQTTTPEPVTQPPKPRTYKPECGRRNIGGVGVRIQNDKFKGSTQFGEWPHMCAVLEVQAVAYGEDINKYVCGASLIAPGVVLTGAHCVFNTLKESIKIRCGEWDSQNEVEPMIHQDREIKDIRIHPQFDSKNIKNDIALLFMEEDFELAPHVDTICLPDNLAGINSYDQIDCFATGWGKDKFGKLGEYQVIMKQVNMDMVNSSECERRLRRTRLGEDFKLDNSFVCAGGEKDRDTCKAGIIAWGIDCGLEGNPGVYANVADGLCFIDWATQCQNGIPQYFNITGSKPQGYSTENIEGSSYADLNLIDDIFGGIKPINDVYGGIEEPQPSYGDGGSHVNEIVDTSYEECAYYADQDYKYGGGLIDIRSSFAAVLDPASSKCPGYLEVCCRHPDFSTNSPQTTTPEPVTQPPKPRSYVPECGRRERWRSRKVQAVAYGDDINKYVCGASLIAPGVVLTGAHLKISKEKMKVRCGEWDSQKEIEPSEHQDRFVEYVKIHPQFDHKNLMNDFALLFTEEDFKLAPHVDTICLPDNLAGIYSYDQNDCFATGWGKDKYGKHGEYQVIMKQVKMDMVNATECERRLRRTRLWKKDRDTCEGDGGGPLVCPLNRGRSNNDFGVVQEPKYVQAGIIAWGIDCGVEGNPGVYANVADGLCFIDWATQCQTGIPQYYKIKGCENWALQQIQSLKYNIYDYQKRIDYITRNGSGTSFNLRNLHRRIKKSERVLKNFEDEHSICIAVSGYGEINQENIIDISGLGRTDGEGENFLDLTSINNKFIEVSYQ